MCAVDSKSLKITYLRSRVPRGHRAPQKAGWGHIFKRLSNTITKVVQMTNTSTGHDGKVFNSHCYIRLHSPHSQDERTICWIVNLKDVRSEIMGKGLTQLPRLPSIYICVCRLFSLSRQPLKTSEPSPWPAMTYIRLTQLKSCTGRMAATTDAATTPPC